MNVTDHREGSRDRRGHDDDNATDRSSPSDGGGGTAQVLLLEDHADTARVLKRLFADHGYTAHAAHTCGEALDTWCLKRCPVLVADLSLPDGSSMHLMRTLRDQGVRGIAVTGHDSPEVLLASREAGFDAFLVKPVDFKDLIALVDRLSQPAQEKSPNA